MEVDAVDSAETMLPVNGVQLCAQTFGRPRDPTVLLVMGAGASMLNWDGAFCRRLAGAGRFVIRYDHRDTGRSSTCPAGAPDYTLRDLVADAVGLLDGFGVARAHVVGMSMGAAIGQLLALDHPTRVATLTLLASSPGGPGHPAPDLPPMSDELAASLTGGRPAPDWSDREAGITHYVQSWRAVAGSRQFDEAAWRDVGARTIDRSRDMAASTTNHFMLEPGEPWRARLGEVDVPTLVLHGADDPFLPPGHGVALAREIPGATLLELPGVGHEPPPPALWDVVVPALVEHTAERPGQSAGSRWNQTSSR
jgi:pimeloyl-ACP methyl ester carboxylesterase